MCIPYRFLFWTESGHVKRYHLHTKLQFTLAQNDGFSRVLKLDRINKRVYWLSWRGGVAQNISSSDYDGKKKRTIVSGSFNIYTLGVSEDLLYFVDDNKLRIKQMNTSKENISDEMMVVGDSYSNLIVLDTSLQPKGK